LRLVADASPQYATIRMHAQDTSGAPLADRDVWLFGSGGPGPYYEGHPPFWRGRTDASGLIEIRQLAGIHAWNICFPGVGCIQSGPIVADPGSTPRVELNRLVPFATISGRIDATLLQMLHPTSLVRLTGGDAWTYRESAIDAEGHFFLADVPIDGDYHLSSKNLVGQSIRVPQLTPGDSRTGLLIVPQPTRPNSALRNGDLAAARATAGPTFRGRVIDEGGVPVPGVEVYVINNYYDGLGGSQQIGKEITDEVGSYEIADGLASYGQITLVALAAGRPPAIGPGGYFGPPVDAVELFGDMSPRPWPESLPKVLEQPDLVLPNLDRVGTLRITTMHEGQLLSGASVAIENLDSRSMSSQLWRVESESLRAALQELYTPKTTSSEIGEALFRNLAPGSYRITARMPGDDRLASVQSRLDEPGDTIVPNVSVFEGESRSFAVSVSRYAPFPTTVQIRHADGALLKDSTATVRWPKLDDRFARIAKVSLDNQGLGEFRLGQRGMAQVSAAYATPQIGAPDQLAHLKHPSFSGERWIAVSRLAQRRSPLIIQTHLNRSSEITVFIEDEHGAAVKGVVRLRSVEYGPAQSRSATTDGEGRVHFDRLHSGKLRVDSIVPDWAPTEASLEADEATWENQLAAPVQYVDISPGDSKIVRLRRQPVAYVRGQVMPIPPANRRIVPQLRGVPSPAPLAMHADWSPQTGEFILGPVLPGKYVVELVEIMPASPSVRVGQESVDVAGAGLQRVAVAYAPEKPSDFQTRYITIRGVVTAADGKTPVYAARVAVERHQWVREAVTTSDARGRFTINVGVRRKSVLGSNADVEIPLPVVIASAPGQFGAVVTQLSEEADDVSPPGLRISLPKAASVRGRVTVGGDSPRALPATTQILAKHTRPSLAYDAASMTAAAGADGAYEIRGLTPGQYELQASLDGIWLSGTKELLVPADRESDQIIDLKIDAPGDLAQYRLIDDAGVPIANQNILIKSPELAGPFAKQSRPAQLLTDGAGVLYLEGLSAGEHVIELENRNISLIISVPAIGAPMSMPVELRCK
jgi:hypothetical protein